MTINDVEISGFGGPLINSGAGSTKWDIRGNYLRNGLGEGILYGQPLGGVIEHNTIYCLVKNGVDLGGSSNATVSTNNIYKNGYSNNTALTCPATGATELNQDGPIVFASPVVGSASSNVIVGNHIYSNNSHGVRWQNGGATMCNNLGMGNNVSGNGLDGFNFNNSSGTDTSSNNQWVYNIAVLNGRYGTNSITGGTLGSSANNVLAPNQTFANGTGQFNG